MTKETKYTLVGAFILTISLFLFYWFRAVQEPDYREYNFQQDEKLESVPQAAQWEITPELDFEQSEPQYGDIILL